MGFFPRPSGILKDNLILFLEKSCGIPANPEHGEVVTNDHLLGARATVVCNRG